ncbi:hypothetical protein [Streptomyces aureoverticillatus]|uniref:hypothetical protein n=1 Tax=Streptomyces aureoverticillatus TaxID=66871 RepID=UPI0013DBBA23|nr:hypothetical protein [Streptomyces aureoverticillatus]QIB47745.1 hypothetical protein G3H79_36375 [Streptomyces aureoverticillatus]
MNKPIGLETSFLAARIDAATEPLIQAMEELEAQVTGDSVKICHREHLAALAVITIQRIRENRRAVLAAAEEFFQSWGETDCASLAEELEVLLGSRDVQLLSRILLILNDTFCLPFMAFSIDRAKVAALVARNAAIDGEGEIVDAFSRNVLGLRHTGRWREAVENALLGDWVALLGTGSVPDRYIQELLRQDAGAQHGCLQPLWHRRTRGKRTVLLGQPIDEMRTIADLLIEHRPPEQVLLSADDRLAAVLKHLSPEEAALAWEWAAACGATWAAVAAEVHREQQFGQRVRTKLRRLGKRHDVWAAEADRTARRVR